jgi:hypothetical protein
MIYLEKVYKLSLIIKKETFFIAYTDLNEDFFWAKIAYKTMLTIK